MCGIVGFTGSKNSFLLKKMNNSLIHRGPDDASFFESNFVSLAMRRLSIVDIQTGQQPYYSNDNFIVVIFNGEIYNHKELREKLLDLGFKFKSNHSDGEVIPHLYQKYGIDFIHKINGMFAIALYDKKINKLFLFRDRLGEKPLYYFQREKQLFFASEIKALLQMDEKFSINNITLIEYLQLKNSSAPQTIYEKIKQLQAGEYIEYDLKSYKLKSKNYWNLNFTEQFLDEREIIDNLEHLLIDSVRLRVDCDVEYGAYLSGGLDSSLISSIIIKQKLNNKLKTFSLGYSDNFKNKQNDLYYARKVSQYLGTEHYEYILESQEVFNELEDVMQAFDEPFSGTISTYFLTKLISKHVKVAISGDGSDEMFGSYLTHRLSLPMQYYNKNNKKFDRYSIEERKKLIPFDSKEQFTFLQSIAHQDIDVWRNKLNVFTNEELNKLFPNNEEFIKNPYSNINISSEDMLNQCLEIDQKELLSNQILPFVDRLSMQHSVEVRVPFLDYRIVEYVSNIKSNLKIKDGINKYILKQTALKYLPTEIINRPKEGFVLPVYKWIEDEYFKQVQEKILDSRVIKDLGLNQTYIEDLINTFYLQKQGHAKIWNLYSLAVWYEGRN